MPRKDPAITGERRGFINLQVTPYLIYRCSCPRATSKLRWCGKLNSFRGRGTVPLEQGTEFGNIEEDLPLQGCGSATRKKIEKTCFHLFTCRPVAPAGNEGLRSCFEYGFFLSAYATPFFSCSVAWNRFSH